MTTIAFDGRYLAADGRTCRNASIVRDDGIKLYVYDSTLYANCGCGNWFEAWVNWAEDGANPAAIPVHSLDGDMGCFIRVILIDGQWQPQACDWRMPYFGNDKAPTAYGSGREFAVGAMDAGKTAMEAVAIAARRDPPTGGEIRFIDTQFLGRGVQLWDGVMPSTRFPMPLAS